MRRLRWGEYGPKSIWDKHFGDYARMRTPLNRLELMAEIGLPVGRGLRTIGGLTPARAERYAANGLAWLRYDEKGRIVHAYTCQYSLFTHVEMWNEWKLPTSH